MTKTASLSQTMKQNLSKVVAESVRTCIFLEGLSMLEFTARTTLSPLPIALYVHFPHYVIFISAPPPSFQLRLVDLNERLRCAWLPLAGLPRLYKLY